MAGIRRCPVSSARKVQKKWWEEEEYEKVKQGNSEYDTFPSRELQVGFGNTVTLSTLKKPVHGF